MSLLIILIMIYHLLNSFLVGLCLIDLLERRYPNEYNYLMNIIENKLIFCFNFIKRNFNKYIKPNTNYIQFINFITEKFISFSYNCIYFYSKCQIFFNIYIETNPIYLKLIELIHCKTDTTRNDFLFVKDNFHYNVPIDLPDLIITTNSSMKPALKKITYEGDYKDIDFQESDIKFMLIEFKVGEKEYKIDLKTKEYNYYIVGNKFTRDFFIFYINEYLLTKYEQHEIDKYTLKIIDHNVNKIEITFTDQNESILLEKNGYKLL
jgi:hypothetical protein